MPKNRAESLVLQSLNEFTLNLFKVLSETEGNVFFSPISVHILLSMIYKGSQGTTAQQFAEIYQIPEADIAATGYNEIMKRFDSVANVTLLMTNKIYVAKSAKLLTDFKTTITKDFFSQVESLDFGKIDSAAKTINNWIEKQTHNKFKNFIHPSQLDASTSLILVNAIYFKGDWKYKFNKQNTRTDIFFTKEETLSVPMMQIQEKLYYKNSKNLDAKVLKLPYTNKDFCMIIILPNKMDGIEDVETKLASVGLKNVTKGLTKTKVYLTLPKFKIEQTNELTETLKNVGLGRIFNQNEANFRGMIEQQSGYNFCVNQVVQKAFIEVNEEGAEASAVTVVGIFKSPGIRKAPEIFRADHPFLYIVSAEEGIPLFYGRLSKVNE